MLYPYTSPDRGKYRRIHKQSLHIPMRDGVLLAVDIWLPTKLTPGHRLPTLLHQTRYWRGIELRWPFSMLSDGLLGHEGKMVKELVQHGFAFVNVDCRGSGASYGNRLHPWSPDEVKDGYEIADWILKQPWSSGTIGTVGISYTGTAAEFARTLNHPAIKATMALFSLYDVYDDIALPGGIPHDGFVLEWGRANSLLDKNVLPVDDLIAKVLVKGVAPVGKGKTARTALNEALSDHTSNLGVHETSAGIEYRDQQPANEIVQSMDDFSPHAHQDAANATDIPLLSLSGWRDGAYPHASIRRWLNSASKVNRLVLGPWDHGGKNHISPGHERKLGVELASEAIKFFDHFLKGYPTNLEREAPVQYYCMQEERWHGSSQWPPTAAEQRHCYLAPEGRLLTSSPATSAQTILHNPAQGTGHYTRWRCLRMSLGTGHQYPDRKHRDSLLACFDSEPLAKDMEVTGHPEARLFIRTTEPDGSFFVYLEDITPGGEVRMVTEGLLRAQHYKLADGPSPYRDVVPYRSFRRADASPLPMNEVVELRFDLLPVSYRFKRGHRIRIAIATSDTDNFRQQCRKGAQYELLLGGESASQVILPVI